VRGIASNDHSLSIFIQIEPGQTPKLDQDVVIVSKAGKTEYKNTRKCIDECAQELLDNSEFGCYPEPCPLRDLFLNLESNIRTSRPVQIKKYRELIFVSQKLLKSLN
jgi:hypothetical protein